MTLLVSDTGGSDGRRPDPDLLPRSQRARRERIVEAALALLEQSEYDRIQMRDVAEHASVALATIYRYFSSKEHLYAAVVLEWSKSFRLRKQLGETDGETCAELVGALLARPIRSFERHPQMLRAEIALEASNDVNAREIFYKFGSHNVSTMTSALEDLSPEEAAAVVETTNSVLATQLRGWALGRYAIEDVYAAVQRSVTLIFSAPPGGGTSPQ